MNTPKFIWGLLLSLIGLIFLGTNFVWLPANVWGLFVLLWPLILILIGTRMIVKNDGLYWLFVLIIIIFAGIVVSSNRFTPAIGFESFESQQASFNESINILPGDSLKIDLSGRYEFDIQAGPPDIVGVSATGPQSAIKRVRLSRKDNQIFLTQDSLHRWRFPVWNKPIKATITIPSTLPLELDLNGFSTGQVDGHNGLLDVNFSGASKVSFINSRSMNPNIELSGAGEVILDQCQGAARFDMSGAGKIKAQNCNLAKLDIDASGAGEIEISTGTIQEASINASGASKIILPKPTGTIDQDTSGASKIELK